LEIATAQNCLVNASVLIPASVENLARKIPEWR